MPELLDNSIDLIATDPQYGWSFMGKEWDKAVPSVKIWRECLRVLKPGAFAFIMSGPRLDCLIENGMRIREAGFWIGFTPMFHAFASGFPKAQNIGKAVDKRLGAERKITGRRISAFGDTKLSETKDGRNLWGKQSTKEVILRGKSASPQAQVLDGSYAGFQPKPAVEIILVAMKPLSEKNYVDQVLKNGKGVTWLGDGRISYENEKDRVKDGIRKAGSELGQASGWNAHKNRDTVREANCNGRFPANLLISDDVLNDGKITKSGKDAVRRQEGMFIEHHLGGIGNPQVYHPDSGSFSRYFSLDSWWKKKLSELPKSVQKTFPFLIVSKASKSEKNKGCEGLYWEKDSSSFGFHQIDKERWQWLGQEEKRIHEETGKRLFLRAKGNIHPTVKPLKLACYLITIGSRPGDIILDPFAGSGTIPVGAKILGRNYIAFETEAENVRIAKARLSVVQKELF